MGFLELGYRGAIVFDSNEKNFIFLIKLNKRQNHMLGLLNRNFGPYPTFTASMQI